LAAQDVGDRSGCIQLILSKIARRLVLPMMAANAMPPTSVFGLNRSSFPLPWQQAEAKFLLKSGSLADRGLPSHKG
jgi:hypothetical protein